MIVIVLCLCVSLCAEQVNQRRALALTNSGHVSRAVSALLRSTLPLPDPNKPETITRLKQLLPSGPDPALLPKPPANTAKVIVQTDKKFKQLVRQLANGAAPGPSGWTGEMLRTLLRDKECVDGLVKIVELLRNGAMPPELKPYLTASRLIPLSKPNRDIRPICVGEVLHKLAAKHAGAAIKKPLTALLEKHVQLDESPGGSEIAVNVIQATTTNTHKPLAALCLDITNAFPTVDRAHVLSETYSHPSLSACFNFVAWSYDSPAPLWLRDHSSVVARLSSTQGVKQGCVFGSKLYNLASLSLLRNTTAAHPTSQPVCIADDSTFLLQPNNILPTLDTAIKEAAKMGQKINLAKSSVLYFHDPPLPQPIVDELTKRGVPIHTQAHTHLGAPVGRNQGEMQRLATEIAEEHKALFNALSAQGMPAQQATILLRASGIPRLNYLTRTTTPAVNLPAARLFDQRVIDTLWRILDVPAHLVTPTALENARRPLSLGGLGLRAYESVSPLAFVAAAAQAAPHLHLLLKGHNLPPTSSYQQQYLEHLPTARKTATADTAQRLPPPAQQHDWISFYTRAANSKEGPLHLGLQHELVKDGEGAQHKQLTNRLLAEKRYFELAHKVARKGKWAAAAWTTFPWEPAQSPPSQQFQLVTRTRLELPPLDHSQAKCQKCKANLRGQEGQYHGLHCNNSRRIFGHDQVVQVLKAVIRSASGASLVEPREVPGWGDRRHPDLEVQNGSNDLPHRCHRRRSPRPQLFPGSSQVTHTRPHSTASRAEEEKQIRRLSSRTALHFLPFRGRNTRHVRSRSSEVLRNSCYAPR